MGSIGTMEIMIVLVAALLILGPNKLPDAARQVGKAISEFRRMANGFQNDVKSAFSEEPPPSPPSYSPHEIPPTYQSPVNPAAIAATSEPNASEPGPEAWAEPLYPGDAELPVPPDDPSRN